jgi:hypothetical protein
MTQDPDWKVNLRTLEKQRLTLMVLKDSEVLFRSGKPGLLPVVDLLESSMDNLVGTTVVTRTVGIAVAKLMLWQHVQQIDSVQATRRAHDLLSRSGIRLHAEKLTEELIESGTGQPDRFEAMSIKYDHPELLYDALREELLIFKPA